MPNMLGHLLNEHASAVYPCWSCILHLGIRDRDPFRNLVHVPLQDRESVQRVLALADKANGAVFARLASPEAPAGPPPELAYGAGVADSGADEAWARYQRGPGAGPSGGSMRGAQAQAGPSAQPSTGWSGPGVLGSDAYQPGAVQERHVGTGAGAQSAGIRERATDDAIRGDSGSRSRTPK